MVQRRGKLYYRYNDAKPEKVVNMPDYRSKSGLFACAPKVEYFQG